MVLWSHIRRLLLTASLSLTKFTGCARPSAGTRAFSVGFVAGRSVLTQAALPTICPVKPCRAFWEENAQRRPSWMYSPVIKMITLPCVVFTHLQCSWARSNRPCTHTARWPGGRCHGYGSCRFGYILPHRNRWGTLPGEGQTIWLPPDELCWSKVEFPVSGNWYRP